MDFEKKYKEALELMKDCVPDENGLVHVRPCDIFPELKESEGERTRKYIINHLQEHLKTVREFLSNGMSSPFSSEEIKMLEASVAWLEKQGEQKPAEWSEDDQSNFNELSSFILETYRTEDASRLITWLNDIKDRVQLQPKQEWHEDDEKMLSGVILDLKVFRDKDSGEAGKAAYQTEIDWLKFLRPQNWTKEDKERYISCLQRLGTGNPEQPETINSKWFKEHVYSKPQWKPSDEQMKILNEVLNFAANHESPHWNDYIFGTLNNLIRQLKKLREE